MASSSSNTLGDWWIRIRGNTDELGKDVAKAAPAAGGHGGGGIHSALRGVRTIGHAVTGGAGAAGIGAAIGGAEGAVIGEVLDKVGQLAGKANPAALATFNRAFDDLQATLGQHFVPVLQAGTELLKTSAEIVGGVLNPVLRELQEEAALAAQSLGNVRTLMEAIGLANPGGVKHAYQASAITSTSQYLKNAYEKAGGGGGSIQRIQSDVAKMAERLVETDSWQKDVMVRFGEFVKYLYGQ